MWWKPEKTETVQPRAQGRFYQWKHISEGAKKVDLGSFQWCPVRGSEATDTYWNTEGSLWIPFFTVRVTEHWYRLPREVVDYPSFEIFKSHVNMVLGNGLYMVPLERGRWTRWTPDVHSSLNICWLWFCDFDNGSVTKDSSLWTWKGKTIGKKWRRE